MTALLFAAAESGITWPDVALTAVLVFGFVAFLWVMAR